MLPSRHGPAGTRCWLLLALALGAARTLAGNEAPLARAVEELLSGTRAPAGVVFEIVTEDEDGLEWALPAVERAIRRLRERFPGLPVAVVSHGEEMFALTRDDVDEETRARLARLTRALGAPVHVCGTFAGWRGLAPEDFTEEVDVAAAGPAQVNDYRALGWTVVRVTDGD